MIFQVFGEGLAAPFSIEVEFVFEVFKAKLDPPEHWPNARGDLLSEIVCSKHHADQQASKRPEKYVQDDHSCLIGGLEASMTCYEQKARFQSARLQLALDMMLGSNIVQGVIDGSNGAAVVRQGRLSFGEVDDGNLTPAVSCLPYIKV